MSLDPTEVAALIARAQRACEDITIVQKDIVLTLAETRRLIWEAQLKVVYTPVPKTTRSAADAPTKVTQHTMMHAVRGMIAILAAFPVEVQNKMLKVLIARTIVVETVPLPAPTITPSA